MVLYEWIPAYTRGDDGREGCRPRMLLAGTHIFKKSLNNWIPAYTRGDDGMEELSSPHASGGDPYS